MEDIEKFISKWLATAGEDAKREITNDLHGIHSQGYIAGMKNGHAAGRLAGADEYRNAFFGQDMGK